MQDVFRAIGRLSHSAATVLITGESGTGKSSSPGAAPSQPARERPVHRAEHRGHPEGSAGIRTVRP
jgi:hypothetical protein